MTPDKELGTKKGSAGLKSILDWIYALPLTRHQQAVMMVHAHHCDFWNGHNSRPGTRTIARRCGFKDERRVQQIHRELQANPMCVDCRFTGVLRDTSGRSARCPCHLLQHGPLVETAPSRGNFPATYRLNLDLRPWAPIQLPLAAPRPSIVAGQTIRPFSTVSTASTDPEIHSAASAKFSVIEGEISPRGTPKFRGRSERNFQLRNKEDRLDRVDTTVNDLNTPPARAPAKAEKPNYSREDLAAWLSIKNALRDRLPAYDWDLFVRPARLLWTASARYLVIAVPPGGEIIQRVVENKLLAHEVACNFGRRLLWTRYPDDWEIEQLKQRFGRDLSRKSKPVKSVGAGAPTAAKGKS